MPVRSFNTTGPCKPALHYMLPAEARLPEARGLVDDGLYFVVHAPRQSGKTTTLTALVDSLSAEGERVALLLSCAGAAAVGDDVGMAEDLVLLAIRNALLKRDYPESWLPPSPWPDVAAGGRLNTGLRMWARQCPVPIVLVFDEIDALQGRSLISVLQQLRDGFPDRPEGFPVSAVLCGLRDVRDYKAAAGGNPGRLGTGSPFNIAVKSLLVRNFTRDNVAALYGQHTAETGQEFTENAIDRAYTYTVGQPWLVNALAREVITEMGVKPPTQITRRHIDQAKERLVAARAFHLDSLIGKLAEPRVRRIIEPMLSGGLPDVDPDYNDDVAYVRDLGLIALGQPVTISNPIYREVIARVLAQPVMDVISANPRSFLLPDGQIDLDKLLREFLAFWREQGELMANEKGFDEAGVQLVLLGYLYRIVNGGGFVDSQYGLGRRLIDILIRKPYTDADGEYAVQREALELKVWRHGESDPVEEGLDQLDSYLASLGLETGTLLIFDRRRNAAPLAERGVFTDEVTAEGRKVRLLRL